MAIKGKKINRNASLAHGVSFEFLNIAALGHPHTI